MFTAIPRRGIIPRYICDIARRMKGDICRRGVKAVTVVRKVIVLVLVSLEAGVFRQQALDGWGQEGGGTGVHTVPAIGDPFSASHLQEVNRHSFLIFPHFLNKTSYEDLSCMYLNDKNIKKPTVKR
jgi:hypothetical protein